MNLREIEYIVAVADLRNFSQAAQQCAVSQPTLSAQIKKLEEHLGVVLFERTNRRVMPTDIGEEIIGSARRILIEAEAIRETAKTAHDPFSGKFRLGAFPTLASYIFPDLVPAITEAMPRLRLILMEEKTDRLVDKLRQGALDAALLALPVQDDYLRAQKLFDDPFYLAVSAGHPLARTGSVSTDALHRYRPLLLEDGHCLRDQALDVCRSVGAAEDPDFRATSLETLRQMVKADTGVTLMPEIAVKRDESDIVYLPFAEDAPSRAIGLVWRKTFQRAKILEMIADMMQTLHARRNKHAIYQYTGL